MSSVWRNLQGLALQHSRKYIKPVYDIFDVTQLHDDVSRQPHPECKGDEISTSSPFLVHLNTIMRLNM